MQQYTGGCLCGAVKFLANGAPDRIGICHCTDCRKHHGAIFYAAAVFPRDAVVVMGEPRAYAGRHFCPICGGSVFARSGDEIELHLGALENGDTLVPTYECWTARRAPWLPDFAHTIRYKHDRAADGSLDA